MKDYLSATDLQNMLLKLYQDIALSENTLTELDSAIGDGDLGMTLMIGFKEVDSLLKSHSFHTISELLPASAEAFSEKAASTFATLFTIMLKAAGKAASEYSSVGTSQAAAMLEAAVSAVQKRGKAQLGDKTLLDALIPAAQALKQADRENLPLSQAAVLSLKEAREGAEKTIAMKARTGRSGYLGDRTIGQKDPGAAAVVVILESFVSYIV